MTSADPSGPPPAPKPSRDLKSMLAEYGSTALIVYLGIFAAVLVSFWFAIRVGWRAESAAGTAGTWAAAYVATKVTQPLRIAATLVITPIAAKVYERVRGRRQPANPEGR